MLFTHLSANLGQSQARELLSIAGHLAKLRDAAEGMVKSRVEPYSGGTTFFYLTAPLAPWTSTGTHLVWPFLLDNFGRSKLGCFPEFVLAIQGPGCSRKAVRAMLFMSPLIV
jgi:hypothetical protein